MAGRVRNDISTAYNAEDVTPSDATVLPAGVRSLYIGVSGNVAVRMVGGGTVTFLSVPIGMLGVQVDQVLSTGTTATNIVALY